MDWIYLSPHFDDVALSCGGLVWEQVRSGEKVSVWTIFTGEPPLEPLSSYAKSLHNRWETRSEAVSERRVEDMLSNQRMGATPRYFSIPDAIYRRSPVDGTPLYTSDSKLFGELPLEETQLVEDLEGKLSQALPQSCELVCPLAVGGHVDHRLVRIATEGLNRQIWYYPDYPYIEQFDISQLAISSGMQQKIFPVSEEGLDVWVAAIASYASQISTFWSDLDQMQIAIRSYWEPLQGVGLWRVI